MKRTMLLMPGIVLSMSIIVNASKFEAVLSKHSSLPYFIAKHKSTSAFCRPAHAASNADDRMTARRRPRVSDAIRRSTATTSDGISGGEGDDGPPTVRALLLRARNVRTKLCGDDSLVPPPSLRDSHLSYPASAYDMETDRNNAWNRKGKEAVRRGFCNWLLPRRIMIGQYPGTTPELNGPSSKECLRHIQNMVQDANVSLFCCLQSEVPPQDDDAGWGASGGEVYLTPESVRREFPRPFTRYGPSAQSFSDSPLTFLHAPIEDLGVPGDNGALLSLLSRLLGHLDEGDSNAIYLHCWGGRGRAGLVGSCLASLLFPELSPREISEWVQRAYDARAGAESMPEGLRRSPQTERQRRFVRDFVAAVRAEVVDEGTR